MEILLTNDDGIHADGLWALYECLVRRNEVRVVAPDVERTGVGHGITLNVPIRVRKITVNGGFKGYAVGGTPADCVKLGILELMKRKPDMVIFIDIPAEESIKRAGRNADRHEKLEKMEKVRGAYLELSSEENFIVIDGNKSINAVFEDVLKAIA